MVRLVFDEDIKEWKKLEEGEKDEKEVYIDGKLKDKLDYAKNLMKRNWDVVFCIDGIEGCGKSTLAISCAYYMSDGKLTPDNLCSGVSDAVEKLQKLPDGSTMIFDEGGLVFSSKEVMRKTQTQIVKILNVIRQKRMCLIVVAPSFFNLNKYIAVERSRFLLHCYTGKNLERGYFLYFGEGRKQKLYVEGKKKYNSYNEPPSNFRGRFTKFNPFGDDYLEIKKQSLIDAFSGDKRIEQINKTPIEYNKLPTIEFKTSKEERHKDIIDNWDTPEQILADKHGVTLGTIRYDKWLIKQVVKARQIVA